LSSLFEDDLLPLPSLVAAREEEEGMASISGEEEQY